MNAASILLNGDYTFLCILDWKRAISMVVAGKVRVLKYSTRIIRGVDRTFRVPAVMVLDKVVRSVYRGRVPFSRKNVLIRDRYTCVYCGRRGKPLTIDHVVPRSRGGATDFDNCVACCPACNHRKGARTPRQAGMHLERRPYQPTISEFIRIRLQHSGALGFLMDLGLYRH